MTNRQAAQETRNITVCAFLEVPANAAIYASHVAFGSIATKMAEDSAAAVTAGTKAGADNTGYSVDKIVDKEAASQLAAQLCASCIVKLELLGNHGLSDSLNGAATFYSTAKDAVCTNRLMNVYGVMDENLELITPDYLTATQLATFLTKINNYTTTKGSSILVNNNSPVLTKSYDEAMRQTNTDVATIKELAKFYKITEPTFYAGIMKACKMPAVTVHHTPVIITITDASSTGVLAGVHGVLTKSKEQPVSNVAGIMTYSTVLGGSTTATFSKKGFHTVVREITVVSGKKNAFSVALVPGIMTAAQEEAIASRIAQALVDEKALVVARKKAREAAIAATAAAKLLLTAPLTETVVVATEPPAEPGAVLL